ncbi:hypothetical protein F4778DRAFT_748980, partial [Xylariomycetidae sp. FL2044]
MRGRQTWVTNGVWPIFKQLLVWAFMIGGVYGPLATTVRMPGPRHAGARLRWATSYVSARRERFGAECDGTATRLKESDIPAYHEM